MKDKCGWMYWEAPWPAAAEGFHMKDLPDDALNDDERERFELNFTFVGFYNLLTIMNISKVLSEILFM